MGVRFAACCAISHRANRGDKYASLTGWRVLAMNEFEQAARARCRRRSGLTRCRGAKKEKTGAVLRYMSLALGLTGLRDRAGPVWSARTFPGVGMSIVVATELQILADHLLSSGHTIRLPLSSTYVAIALWRTNVLDSLRPCGPALLEGSPHRGVSQGFLASLAWTTGRPKPT